MDLEKIAIVQQIFSSLFAAITAMLIKLVQELDFNQTLYLRALCSFVLLVFAVNHYKLQAYNFDKQTMVSLIQRGLLAGFGAFIYFKGLDLVLVSESIILNRMSPLWTSFIQIVVLKKEQFNLRLLLNMVLCSLGIYLVTGNTRNQKQHDEIDNQFYHIIGILLILLASILQAIVNILIKQLDKQVVSIVISCYQSFFAIIFPSCNSLITGSNYIIPSMNTTLMIIVLTVVSLLAGQLQIIAMRQGKLSVISNVSQIQILFGYLIDFLVFKITFTGEQILGNFLLLLSIIPLIWK
ncbi:unnamed protein product (macronuclear) [Paramecium tetraurelia]|uniref:EamA domain-containing protein n=1 Tax=Paramecium tetraurelia TaxID=5888 RepID=A0D7U3_PARTE|nr:uncharacterized protein GSPATT00014077001 [Paramecium tetraurelia]CAK79110.1 unnamed protein product [Paramecium tetraurelia]|eukprot:XP_001446507.1 hypothetical protein (macronuclear) [Paramecium tetraurelia strain d4-2]